MWAAAAPAPASEEPTLRTTTAIPRSAQSASAAENRSPSPSDSRNRAIDRTPSWALSAESQSLASQTAWFPVEITVWKSIPRREPSALTATLPLWEISATPPAGSAWTESPHMPARAVKLTIPFPFGPQTGNDVP